ncbi:MAG: hypothetical protein P8O03_03145 [Ilumatobacter sp.]|nr:hypothetical protein [Ilumatobacter sp.]
MSVHQIHAEPLPGTQRAVLQLAERGDLNLVKGIAAQRKALVRKGHLAGDHSLTDLGRAQLEFEYALQAPAAFSEVCQTLGQGFHRRAHLSATGIAQGYGMADYVGAVSCDGRTGYVVRRSHNGKGFGDPIAVDMGTVPSEFREFFGASPLGGTR